MTQRRPASRNSHARPGPSVWHSARLSLSSLMDDLGSFLAANGIWAAIALLAVAARNVFAPGLLVALLLVPATCGLARMACRAARGHSARLSDFTAGVRHRFRTHLALGFAQCVLLLLASVNITVALAGGGLLIVATGVVTAYVALALLVTACATWPLLLDPARAVVPWRRSLRLALAVVAARPFPLFAVAMVQMLLAAITVQTTVPLVFLPSYGVLLAAHFVIPAADQIESGSPSAPGATPDLP